MFCRAFCRNSNCCRTARIKALSESVSSTALNKDKTMKAMVLKKLKTALEWTDLADRNQGRVRFASRCPHAASAAPTCMSSTANCPTRISPIIPGHEIVGRIDAIGAGVEGLHMGERVGIPWLGHTCGVCPYCVMHRENLCDRPLFTGFTRDGGLCDGDDR